MGAPAANGPMGRGAGSNDAGIGRRADSATVMYVLSHAIGQLQLRSA